MTDAERIEARLIRDPSGCWLWPGSRNRGGYGRYKVRGVTVNVHRTVYEAHRGPIPEGLTLDHLCRVRHCANPAHLEPVTQRENTLRSPIALTAVNARKTACPRGHPYDGVKRLANGTTERQCKRCNAEAFKEKYRQRVRSTGREPKHYKERSTSWR